MADFEAKVEALRQLRERREARSKAAEAESRVASDQSKVVGEDVLDAENQEGDMLFCLGHCCEHGLNGYEQDLCAAINFYLSSARAGHPVAQWRVGELYEAGRGVLQSDAEAMRWYLLAAEAGNMHAQSSLALLLEEGRGPAEGQSQQERTEEAFRWHFRAASAGHALSQYCLAMCLREGRGTDQDPDAAQMWLKRSSVAGFPPASEAAALVDARNETALENAGLDGGGSSLIDMAQRIAQQIRELDAEEQGSAAFVGEVLAELPDFTELECN
mmetsp:Transcript_12586/g.28495  ORF Transcript_12586/g.28495 Transcript_12586/m.28495 type:complete len:273 (-) Transcript_12586:44-862(-)